MADSAEKPKNGRGTHNVATRAAARATRVENETRRHINIGDVLYTVPINNDSVYYQAYVRDSRRTAT